MLPRKITFQAGAQRRPKGASAAREILRGDRTPGTRRTAGQVLRPRVSGTRASARRRGGAVGSRPATGRRDRRHAWCSERRSPPPRDGRLKARPMTIFGRNPCIWARQVDHLAARSIVRGRNADGYPITPATFKLNVTEALPDVAVIVNETPGGPSALPGTGRLLAVTERLAMPFAPELEVQ
jgi:hypothetical protein